MRMYILRHGEAGRSQFGQPDDARTLTDEGREEMRAIGRRLADLGVDTDVILTSPLPRALETAEIVAEALDLKAAVVVDEALAPGCPPGEFQASVLRHNATRVMLVGHEPDLSTLIGWLTGGRVDLPKAGFARLNGDFEPDRAALKWLLTPEVMTSPGD